MWSKIKNALCIIGAFSVVAVLSAFVFCTKRKTFCDNDAGGSTGNAEADRRITEGLSSSEARLRRAEEILRNAINRSKERNEEGNNNV